MSMNPEVYDNFQIADISNLSYQTLVSATPSGKRRMINNFYVNNKIGSATTFSVRMWDNSASTFVQIILNMQISPTDTFYLDRPILLDASDYVEIISSVAASTDVSGSYVQYIVA